MLPHLYPAPGVPRQVTEDFEQAPIPELHKQVFRWTRRFVEDSWEFREDHIAELRGAGLGDADIVSWAQIACLQTWWVMSADGGGIPLEGDAVVGPVIGWRRDSYEANRGVPATMPQNEARVPAREPANGICWVEIDESAETYQRAALWARERYGFVPNLFRAVSLQPEIFRRHVLALELLERPQSDTLSPRQHALVRALVSALNSCEYSRGTTRAQLARVGEDPELYEHLPEASTRSSREPADRAVLAFATNLARHSYKVTEKDAITLRETGLDDEAYVDVLNTVAIQTSLDRLANSLGVVPDPEPLLPVG